MEKLECLSISHHIQAFTLCLESKPRLAQKLEEMGSNGSSCRPAAASAKWVNQQIPNDVCEQQQRLRQPSAVNMAAASLSPSKSRENSF